MEIVSKVDKIVLNIRLGLGDCLLYCQIYNLYKNEFKYQYVLNENIVKMYKEKYLEHIEFVKNIFNIFEVPLEVKDEPFTVWGLEPKILLLEYPIVENLSLHSYIYDINTELPSKYIVVNLNIRIVTDTLDIDSKSILEMMDNLCYVLNNNNFKLPIVIVGHKNSFTTYNVINYSFYDKLNVDKFIDKSYDNFSQVNINNLIYDINVIKKSEETFQFGFGGSLCLNILFSKNLSAVCNPEHEFIQEYFTEDFYKKNTNIKIFNTRDMLIQKLKSYIY
jgi:hypothetical protein